MGAWSVRAPFLLLLFAGLLITVAVTPLVSDEPEALDALNISLPLPSPEDSNNPVDRRRSTLAPPPLTTAPAARSLLSSSQLGDLSPVVLLVFPNGTYYALDPISLVKLWEIHTGSPLSHFEQALLHDDGNGYCMYPGEGGSVYEYSKAFGERKLDTTLEELVHRTPFLEGSAITLGSKTLNILHVDPYTGEVLHEDHFPGALTTNGIPSVKRKSVSFESDDCRTILTIIRINYSLNSTDGGKLLWGMSDSRFRAYVSMYGCQLPSEIGSELAFLPRQKSVDVYRLPEFGKSIEVGYEKFMLPSANSDPKTLAETKQSSLAMLLENAAASGWNVSEILPLLKSEEYDNSNCVHDDPISFCILKKSSGAAENFPLESYGAFRLNGDQLWVQLMRKQSVAQTSMVNQASDRPQTDSCTGGNNCLAVYDAEQKMLPRDSSVHVAKQSIFSEAIYGIFAVLFMSLLLIFSVVFYYLKSRVAVKPNKQLADLKGKETISSKKKKVRKGGNNKNGAIVNNHDGQILSGKQIADSSGLVHGQSNERYSFVNFIGADVAGDGRWIGRLFVTNSEIGKGSNGTIVFEGVHDGRPVAVKRLLHAHHEVAFKEIQNLIASDQHPNIVRWYGVEQDLDFVYISLERCTCSLGDLIQLCADSPLDPTVVECSTSNSVIERQLRINFVKGINEDLELWRADGLPSSQLVKLMRDVVSGLVHLHELGIIHRDMKPQNVLISHDRVLNAKLSDMGISKRLLEDMSSLSHHATGHGSSGWQAPEQLLHGRQTRAVDLFSLGCILFFCMTKGKHPFGSYYERDSNILNNRMDLFLVDQIPEAVHLISQLLDARPEQRPSAREVAHHPLFWSSEMRLAFLRDASDRVELEDRENESELLKALESVAPIAFGGKWGEKLGAAFITDMSRYRKYNFDSTRDLLRVIRNKLNHYREFPKELQEILGPVPEGFDSYFTNRFPKLLIEVYKVISTYCREEDCFRNYFKSNLV